MPSCADNTSVSVEPNDARDPAGATGAAQIALQPEVGHRSLSHHFGRESVVLRRSHEQAADLASAAAATDQTISDLEGFMSSLKGTHAAPLRVALSQAAALILPVGRISQAGLKPSKSLIAASGSPRNTQSKSRYLEV